MLQLLEISTQRKKEKRMINFKFRGKEIETGVWRYGQHITLNKHDYIKEDKNFYIIDPETLGISLDFVDKGIFTGDICKVKILQRPKAVYSDSYFLENMYFTGCVTYKNGMFLIENNTTHFAVSVIEAFPLEVIGNKFDNPGLLTLEGEEKCA